MRASQVLPWALGLAGAMATVMPTGAQTDYAARARELHKQVPVIDGHNDYPWALRERDVGGDFGKADITEPVPSLMTDIPRLRRGGLGAQFWSVYVPSEMQGKEAVRATLEQMLQKHLDLTTGEVTARLAKNWADDIGLTAVADCGLNSRKGRSRPRCRDAHSSQSVARGVRRASLVMISTEAAIEAMIAAPSVPRYVHGTVRLCGGGSKTPLSSATSISATAHPRAVPPASPITVEQRGIGSDERAKPASVGAEGGSDREITAAVRSASA